MTYRTFRHLNKVTAKELIISSNFLAGLQTRISTKKLIKSNYGPRPVCISIPGAKSEAPVPTRPAGLGGTNDLAELVPFTPHVSPIAYTC